MTHTGEASASYVSAFKYHAPLAEPSEDGAPLFAPPHVDGGLLTIILTTQPGLQVSGSMTGICLVVLSAF
jgi:hypothetical protein